MNYTYSIIIPHYQSIKLLKRLLCSIPERFDIQVLVVDDNSSQDVQQQLLSLKHLNLTICLQPENYGAGSARNIGLKKAEGKWILFADADDFFNDNAFEILDKYTSSDLDYLCFCVNSMDNKTKQLGKRNITSDNSVRLFLKKKTQKSLNYFKFRNFACWNKLYSAAFLKQNNIQCEESIVNNDVYFSFQVALFSKKFEVIPDELYCCTYEPTSITYKKRNIEREFLFYIMAKKRNGFYHYLGLGYPFIRYDWLYLLYMIKKRGIIGAYNFYIYSWKHREELKKASQQYLHLFSIQN